MALRRELINWIYIMAKFVPRSPASRSVNRRNALIELFEPRLMLTATGNLVFDDEFDQAVGTQPSTAVWVRDVTNDPNNTNVNYTNTTSQMSIVADPAATDDRALAITLTPEGGGVYDSARITTQVDPIGDSLEYGTVEARIKLPSATNAQGVWPAFWMLGNNINSVSWPESGEIDIVENKGSTPGEAQGSLHAGSVTGKPDYNPTNVYDLPSGQVFSSAYHIFAVSWTPTSISFSVDGNVYETQNISSSAVPSDDVGRFQHPFYIILNIAEGGPFAGGNGGTQYTVTQATTMYVDYVRVSGYQMTASPYTMPNSPAFSDADIGSPVVAGSASFDGIAWTVNGNGSDIWGTSDQFNYASQTISGNFTIVANVNTITNSGNFAKAGIMIRNGTAANAAYAFTFVNPNDSVSGEGVNFEFRSSAGASSQSANSVAGVTAPQWVELTRSGNTFTAFYSTDGVNWTQNGPAETIAMNSSVNAGLAVSSNNTTSLNTAMFSHVSILPTPWSDGDINSPNAQGSADYNSSANTWTIGGGGAQIGNATNKAATDQFNFMSQSFSGDGSVIAEVTSLADTNASSQAGVMLRNDTTAGSLFAAVEVTASQGVSFQWRSSATSAASSTTSTGQSAPLWVKVTRQGSKFSGYYSSDGVHWTQVGTTQTLTMGSTVLAGLAVSADDNFTLNQATFSNVSVVPAFASQSGTTLTVNFDGNADPISLGTSGSTITATELTSTLSFTGVNSIIVNFASGSDVLTFNGPISAPLSLNGAGAADTVNVSSGTLTLAAPASGDGIVATTLGTLSISSGAEAALDTAASHSDRSVLVLNNLSLTGLLDLGANDMIVRGSSVATVTSLIASAYNAGAWNGSSGITSSAAASTSGTSLGIEPGLYVASTFDGQTVADTDSVVKYTYIGDANLDGIVNGSDYTLIDNGLNNALTGWHNGDFNYDGLVNGDDYTLIDNSYNTQGPSLAALATSMVSQSKSGAAAEAVVSPPAVAAAPWSQDQAISFPIDSSGWDAELLDALP